jgi:hypothetical protein
MPSTPTTTRASATIAPATAVSEPSLDVLAGPELRALLRRLALLDLLCRRGRFRAAALLLSDVQAKLREFDPVRYFPSLFSDYLRALVTHGDALTQAQAQAQAQAHSQRANADQPADIRLTALRQLLHSDVELFARLAQELP